MIKIDFNTEAEYTLFSKEKAKYMFSTSMETFRHIGYLTNFGNKTEVVCWNDYGKTKNVRFESIVAINGVPIQDSIVLDVDYLRNSLIQANKDFDSGKDSPEEGGGRIWELEQIMEHHGVDIDV